MRRHRHAPARPRPCAPGKRPVPGPPAPSRPLPRRASRCATAARTCAPVRASCSPAVTAFSALSVSRTCSQRPSVHSREAVTGSLGCTVWCEAKPTAGAPSGLANLRTARSWVSECQRTSARRVTSPPGSSRTTEAPSRRTLHCQYRNIEAPSERVIRAPSARWAAELADELPDLLRVASVAQHRPRLLRAREHLQGRVMLFRHGQKLTE